MLKLIYRIYIPLIFVFLLLYTAKTNWSDGQWESVIEADAKGYYAYLPALLIYGDLNFGFYDKVEVENTYDQNLIYDYRAYYEGRCINKYYAGESFLVLPFFATAHLISHFYGYPTDGYSRLYVISITIAALFYLLIGLMALRRTFFLFGISEFNSLIVISTLIFGTNLFYYSIGEVGMTHVYSFSMMSLFIYQVSKYFNEFQAKHIVYGAIFLGLIILIRPINAIIIFSIPFLSQNVNNFMRGIKNYFLGWKILMLSIVIILSICSIQLIIYKCQTGTFFVYSYGKEGFNFGSPQIANFLFSYKKGFFLYTPICLISLFGFASIWKDKFKVITLFCFLFVVVYTLSSWWMWYYGGSFSSRVMVDFLPFYAILLGLLLQGTSKTFLRGTCFTVFFLLVLLNQIQTLQYRYYVIHWSNMDKESYWDTFLDIEPILNRKIEIE